MCRRLLEDKNIKGMKIGAQEMKVLAYADDVSIVCSSTNEVRKVLEHIKCFGSCSGAELNLHKAPCTTLGRWEEPQPSDIEISWSADLGKYLGIRVNVKESLKDAWASSVPEIVSSLQPLRGRNLTLPNRAHICNTVLFPRILDAAQMKSCSNNTVKKLHWSFATFVWQSSF